MDLVPKYADEAGPGETGGAVYISPARQQLIGVRTGPVVRRPVTRVFRTVGTVAVDETRIHHIHTRISGWVRHVYVSFAGQFIRKGQPILDIYSPDVLATEQEYLLALRLRDSLRDADPEALRQAEQAVRDALQRLRLWDVSPDEIERLERTRQPAEVVPIRADMTGYVLELNVRHGMYVTPEMEIYKIADLSRVWVQTVAYESDLEFVRVGLSARITTRGYPDRVWEGVVDYVYPDVDPQTRTVRVRLSLPNPDYVLKPGMYVDAELRQDLGERLVVPAEAVINTGVRQYVFVVRGEGTFEPRPIRTGARVEDGYVVLEGLQEGDVVVTSAQFLIDSESQFQAALEAFQTHGEHGRGQ
jgi:RND family efflux transporter MFP subunit